MMWLAIVEPGISDLDSGRPSICFPRPQHNEFAAGDGSADGANAFFGGQDSDLQRWGWKKLAERRGKNAKKRAVIAVARKWAVLQHKLWVSREVYEPLTMPWTNLRGNFGH